MCVCVYACMHDVLCMIANVYDVLAVPVPPVHVYACVHMMYEFEYVCCVTSTSTMH